MSIRSEVRTGSALEVLASLPARRALAVAAFAMLTAVGARISVPLGPVPVTMQTLAVALAGLLLGARLGALSQLIYLAMGAAGMPVFAQSFSLAALLGPTGGYLLAFPAAAALTGWCAARARQDGVALLALATTLGTAVVYLGGWAQLTLLTGDAGTALTVGVLPFLAGEALKVALAVVLADRLRRHTRALR